MSITASDWTKGIFLSVLATIIGGASKLAIRKSWLMEQSSERYGIVKCHDTSCELRELESQSNNRESTKCIALVLRLSGMFGMTFLNPFCGVLAMNYASPSITAPFSGLTLVWIIMFSKTFTGEQPSNGQIFASSLIVLGEVVVAVFGDHTNDEGTTLADLEASYREPAFISFFVAMALWLLLLYYWVKYSNSSFLKRFAWGVSGGCVTGIQNFLKDCLTIIKVDEGLPRYFFIMIACAMAAAFGGLLLLTACMKRYDVTYSSAMFVGSYVVVVSIMSSVHYNTFQNLEDVINYILYPTGLAIIMTGVWILLKEGKAKEPWNPGLNGGAEMVTLK
mmetsp:Transcript_28007/g.41354  ORF Transcript_28007/g.41354 Transcript_28007/m.41354 type:complete len:335 (-) Transcript_28007:108-1112(-)|eukprot:CAMPEP_0194215972 /NCGR_PEP_ID=MMETSP0156-20130528/18143_1 /TAXON_ID=33649 /ORGANISM="Thalassionema nitzschioides, Strain L26-B" /LENGTH=334 /DNA_ID=CAMNT_0038944629 /DNA_START=80 /DNA_END=1084 /DNA_ORIENTATION=+